MLVVEVGLFCLAKFLRLVHINSKGKNHPKNNPNIPRIKQYFKFYK